MTTKTINLGRRNAEKAAQPSADAWVAQGAETAAKPVEKRAMKRLSFEIPSEMHRELMIYCVTKGIKMSELLRRLIARELAGK